MAHLCLFRSNAMHSISTAKIQNPVGYICDYKMYMYTYVVCASVFFFRSLLLVIRKWKYHRKPVYNQIRLSLAYTFFFSSSHQFLNFNKKNILRLWYYVCNFYDFICSSISPSISFSSVSTVHEHKSLPTLFLIHTNESVVAFLMRTLYMKCICI